MTPAFNIQLTQNKCWQKRLQPNTRHVWITSFIKSKPFFPSVIITFQISFFFLSIVAMFYTDLHVLAQEMGHRVCVALRGTELNWWSHSNSLLFFEDPLSCFTDLECTTCILETQREAETNTTNTHNTSPFNIENDYMVNIRV